MIKFGEKYLGLFVGDNTYKGEENKKGKNGSYPGTFILNNSGSK